MNTNHTVRFSKILSIDSNSSISILFRFDHVSELFNIELRKIDFKMKLSQTDFMQNVHYVCNFNNSFGTLL